MLNALALLSSPRALPSFCRLPFPPLSTARAANCHIHGSHLFVSAARHRLEDPRRVSSRAFERVSLEE